MAYASLTMHKSVSQSHGTEQHFVVILTLIIQCNVASD